MNDVLTIAAVLGVGYLLWERSKKDEPKQPVVEPEQDEDEEEDEDDRPIPPIPSLDDFPDAQEQPFYGAPIDQPHAVWDPQTHTPQTSEPAQGHVAEQDPDPPATEPIPMAYSATTGFTFR